MTADEILKTLLADYKGTRLIEAWGEKSLFYNPERLLPRGVYFATIKDRDGENDNASKLDRESIFRLNIGTSRARYLERFGDLPKRPAKGEVIEGAWQFTDINILTPHPIYGWMGWVSVINPTQDVFTELQPMIDAAYEKAVRSFEKRIKK